MSEFVRRAASATVSLTGIVVLAVMAGHVASGWPPFAGLLLVGLGTAVGLVLLGLGYAVYRYGFTTRQTVRIAAWNALGIVVIAAAVALLYAYQAAVGSPPATPVFSATVLIAISSFAHVLIGVNDARRIRSRELARERRKLGVLSRLVRHDLRTISQYLHGDASRVRGAETDAEREAVADDIRETAADLAGLHEHLQTLRALVENPPAAEPVDVTDLVVEAVAAVRDEHPNADITVDAPDSARALAGEYATDAVYELVENAVEHTDGPVAVRVSREGNRVSITVHDEGPGVPEMDRDVVLGERELTQLRHASGLGLWVAKWVADAYDGDLAFDEDAVTLRFRSQ